MIELLVPRAGLPSKNGLRLRPVYGIDFTTGLGIEHLTFNSASAGAAGQGKHVLVRTDSGGLTWAPAPAGVHSGWRGIQLVSGLDGQPTGWLMIGPRLVYHFGAGHGISWQYIDGSPLPDVSFIPSAPARTNYATHSKGPPSASGWTITDAAGHTVWSPYGARRFYNISGYGVSVGSVASWPGGNAHFEAIVEHGGDANDTVARLHIINNTTSTNLAVNWIATINGLRVYQEGDYYGEIVLTATGPNGGTVTKLWCGANNPPVGHQIVYNIYPTADQFNRSTIIHHLEARIGETSVIGPPIFTNDAAETVLAETSTIEDATIDDGPFTLILDLAPEIYAHGGLAMIAAFGAGRIPIMIWESGAVRIDNADDGVKHYYGTAMFPTIAARIAVRRQMPGGTIEFYSGSTGQSYSLPEGATYTKTNGNRLLLGTWAHNVSPQFYPNRPLKRLEVYKHALTNDEIETMLTISDFPIIAKRLVIGFLDQSGGSGGSGGQDGQQPLLAYDVDFTTGLGIEHLTFNSASAGAAGQGKHVLVRTDSGGLTWAPAPAGVHSGWRGIQLVSGLDGQPAGWLQVGPRNVYHLGSGWGISWQYPDGSPLPDVSFVPSAPGRTNYVTASRGPSSVTGWTITDVAGHPEWSPYGARRFYRNSGAAFSVCSIVSQGGSAHFESIVEHGGDASDAIFGIKILNSTTSSTLSQKWFYTATGQNHPATGDGYFGIETLGGSGPNGGPIYRAWCGVNNTQVGHTINFYIYPTANVSDRSSIVHHLEVRVGETSVIGPPIFTDGTAETVLAETTTIEDPTIDDGPFTLIIDLTPEIYPRGSEAAAVAFGGDRAPIAVQADGTVVVATTDDGASAAFQSSTFPAGAARVAVRRQMPGGTIEFYSGETGQSYSLPDGKSYTKTDGAKLLLGTLGHDVGLQHYLNRPLKRLKVYKAALTNEEIALA